MTDSFTATAMSPEESSLLASIRTRSRYGSDGSSSQSSTQSTTFDTITSPTASATSSAATAASSGFASQSSASASSGSGASVVTATASSNAVSSTVPTGTSAANSSENDLHAEASTMSSPGMQAAIAVPVVVAVLAALALIFFCMRRRRKRREAVEGTAEKASPAARKKKNWTRHFRVFSFDTELLMGGRYSSTNSIRSRQTGSTRSANRSTHTGTPSIHSVDDVAPPYRDAITSVQAPSIAQIIAGGAAGGAAAGVSRSASNATAPPPYGVAAGRLGAPSPTTPVSQRSNQNPFADSPPVSPIENSPFNDPPGTTPTISRNSSVYHTDRDDVSTIGGASDAASIREATLARNASVMSGGRIINNVSGRPS